MPNLDEAPWSPWLPLASRDARLDAPIGAGLYRVRVIGSEPLAYLGQTGRLRGRLRDLTAFYGEEIPYNDPHTAAPCLWVLRTRDGAAFEFSWLAVSNDTASRKGLECLAVSEHRLRFGTSPSANFGRMPDGWVKSSGNTRALAQRGLRRRGYVDPTVRRTPDLPPIMDSFDSPVSRRWSGLEWSPWEPFPSSPTGVGLYRIRTIDSTSLAYIGQGRLADRLRAHAAKASDDVHRQSLLFSGVLEASWAPTASMAAQQLLEAECDLIAGHVAVLGEAPSAQFLG